MLVSGIVAVIGVLAGTFLFLSQKNFFRRLWETDAQTLNEYIIDINAGARGAYSAGALAAFEEYPLTGVGLGASGFYIYQNLPDWSLTTVPEIAKQLSPENRLYPNPKNLYARLLAETGLIGFFLFIAFQFHILGDMLNLYRRNEAWARFAAVAGHESGDAIPEAIEREFGNSQRLFGRPDARPHAEISPPFPAET